MHEKRGAQCVCEQNLGLTGKNVELQLLFYFA